MNQNKVKLPKLNSEIAELCGIITGDGHLSRYISPTGTRNNSYCIFISCNKTEEIDYFTHLTDLFRRCFGVKLKIKIEQEYARLYKHSKSILEFFEHIGVIVGNKSKRAFIPKIILDHHILSVAFLRGLADTDFSMAFKKGGRKNNSYPRIVGSSASKKLLDDVELIISRIGMNCYRYTIINNNSFGHFIHHRLEINGRSNFKLWMRSIGFSNPKHITKIRVWKKLGYCPPYTTYSERLKILEGQLPTPNPQGRI